MSPQAHQPFADSRPFHPAACKPRQQQAALVIEDDKFMRTVMCDLLRELGFRQITEAASGSAAVDALKRLSVPPELLLCDLNMPGGDGFELMQHLGASGFAGAVILVSGMDARTLNSASLMARFHRLNILATLSKPVDETALSAAVAKLA